jgi:Ca2+-binding RTX toxin-like protein
LIRYIFLITIAVIVSVYLPTQTMGADIICNSLNCIGTNEDDTIVNRNGIAERITARGGNDVIVGSDRAEAIWGEDGDDIILAGDANDIIFGGRGNDKIDGGGGFDNTEGSEGNDDIAGGPGNDEIWGDSSHESLVRFAGSDRISGGPGDDSILTTMTLARDFHLDTVNCGMGNDRVVLRSSDGDFANSNCETVYDLDG